MQLSEGMSEALFACFLGVISHIEADIALHPFVYAHAASPCIGQHYRLETDIDLHFVRRGAAPSERRLDRLLCAANPLTGLYGVGKGKLRG